MKILSIVLQDMMCKCLVVKRCSAAAINLLGNNTKLEMENSVNTIPYNCEIIIQTLQTTSNFSTYAVSLLTDPWIYYKQW
jgi:hypothetical protein